MQRTLLLTVILALSFFTGCQESTGNVYFIMFESTPNIFGNQIYARGVPVGEIVATETAGNGVARLAVVVEGEHRAFMLDSTAFYVSSGRLTYAALAGYGNPVEPGAKMLGFGSSLALSWFKTKNILTQTPRAASEQAGKLFESFEASA